MKEVVLHIEDRMEQTLYRILNDYEFGDCVKSIQSMEREVSLAASADNNIFAIFDKAKETLKYPKIKIIRSKEALTNGSYGTYPRFIFSMTGEKSKVPGSISVTDDGKYPGNKFYARITRGLNNTPQVKWYDDVKNDKYAKSEIETILGDPLGFGKMHGLKFSNCMFCGRELTNKNSLTVGYGPICAEVWGLPWEGTADAKEMEEEREAYNNL